jgi:hypothetical protein
MVAPVHFDPKILPKGSARLRWVGQGQGTSYFVASVVPWKEKSPGCGRPKFDIFCLFLGSNNKQRSCDGQKGARSALFGVAMS